MALAQMLLREGECGKGHKVKLVEITYVTGKKTLILKSVTERTVLLCFEYSVNKHFI